MPPGVSSSLGAPAKLVLSANPTAGNEFSVTVPAGKSWVLLSVTVALVQGATQTPQPILVIDDGTTTLMETYGASDAQAVSTTSQYTWAPGLLLSAHIGLTTDVHAQGSFPKDYVVPSGGRVRSRTVGIGANSDYGIAALWVVEYG
jgi:hypothetical protein